MTPVDKRAAMQAAAEEFYSRQLGQLFDTLFVGLIDEPAAEVIERFHKGMDLLDRTIDAIEREIEARTQ